MATVVQTFRKDPASVLDYGIDWSSWLVGLEWIATSVWTVPSGITKTSDSKADTSTLIWLSGGEAGKTYTITNTITTNAGRTVERSIQIIVEER